MALKSTVTSLPGDEPTNPQDETRYKQLVAQLGAPSFEDREKATRELSALGLQPRNELRAGMRDSSVEIRWRSTLLWQRIAEADFEQRASKFIGSTDKAKNFEFWGWSEFRTMFGPSKSSRQLFVSMQRIEPLLWQEFATDDSDFPRFRQCASELRSQLSDSRASLRIDATLALSMLFLATQYLGAEESTTSTNAPSDSRLSLDEIEWMGELWSVPGVIEVTRTDPTCKSLKTEWELLFPDERTLVDRMMAYRRLDTLRAVPVARRLLRDERLSANDMQYALLVLADSDNPDDTDLIQAFGRDTTLITRYPLNGLTFTSTVRDVALAALILRSGREPREFGFQFYHPNKEQAHSPRHLGFADDRSRARAFEAWNDAVRERR